MSPKKVNKKIYTQSPLKDNVLKPLNDNGLNLHLDIKPIKYNNTMSFANGNHNSNLNCKQSSQEESISNGSIANGEIKKDQSTNNSNLLSPNSFGISVFY